MYRSVSLSGRRAVSTAQSTVGRVRRGLRPRPAQRATRQTAAATGGRGGGGGHWCREALRGETWRRRQR